jgi:hypothetical protein
MDSICGELRAARKHMEDLDWTGEKREGGGDIIDLLIRVCFIQGLYDERIKTMVKTKGCINTPHGTTGGNSSRRGVCHQIRKV